MNKTMLLVAAILGGLAGIGLIFYGVLMFSIVEFLIRIAPEMTPQDINALKELQGVFNVFAFIVILIGILNIVAGFRLNFARNDKASRKTALGWSIYLLLCGGFIPGILGIIGVGSDTDDSFKDGSFEEKLREADSLYNRGLITKEEYDQRRANIINKI